MFRAQLERYGGGGRLTVFQHGRLLLDVWGGVTDKDGSPWNADTLAYCASCTKGVTNVCVALLVDRGVLRYDVPVAQQGWPEFRHKHLTLSELLTHRAGLLCFDEMIDFPTEALESCSGVAWEAWIDFLARQEGVAEARGAIAYHAVTVGFFVSALVFKVTGHSLRRFYQDNVAVPFGVRYFMGAVESEQQHLGRVLPSKVKEKKKKTTELAGRAYMPMNGMSSFWTLRNTESPSHIGWGSGQSLAWLWQLVVQDRLFSRATRLLASEPVCRTEKDLVLDEAVEWTRGGFMNMESVTSHAGTVGHTGMGGQFAFCDARYGLSVGCSVNAFMNDSRPRQREVVNAIYSALEAMASESIKSSL